MVAQAPQEQLLVVTTEKDIVRLRDVVSHVERNIHAFAVTLEIEEGERLRAVISDALKSFRASKSRIFIDAFSSREPVPTSLENAIELFPAPWRVITAFGET